MDETEVLLEINTEAEKERKLEEVAEITLEINTKAPEEEVKEKSDG